MQTALSPVSTFLIEYLDLPTATGDPDARWESYQIKHLNNSSILAIEEKARQVGWSWTAAAEAVGIGTLYKRSTAIFVSINQEEASEKIRYANEIIDALDRDVRPKKTIDNKFTIEFENGSRLISHPCRPVRGKAKAYLYLDEFAHYPNDREVYQSAVPVITKGGQIRIGSSPLGATGMFWEIFTESLRPYPGFSKTKVPWWSVHALCKDVRMAVRVAPGLTTANRVYTFGTERLIYIYENTPLDDFMQEFECEWVDESVSWIDWELIKRNQTLAAEERLVYLTARGVDAALSIIDRMTDLIRRGEVEDVLSVGVDIGRTHDATEIIILGRSTTNQLPYRAGITLEKTEFDDQLKVLSAFLDAMPIVRMNVDQTGLGMNLAENLTRIHGERVAGMSFTAERKELWATDVKVRFQRGEVPIPLDRDLAYQIHSVKRIVTATKNFKFDVSSSEKHHADKFWALALALDAAAGPVSTLTVAANPIAGYRG